MPTNHRHLLPHTPATMIGRRSILLAGLGWTMATPAIASGRAAPPEVAQQLPQAQLRGSGRLTYFTLHVYDARLWVAPGFKAASFASTPLALELEYARSLNGKAIAERSIEEMARQTEITEAKSTQWLAQMIGIFGDVKAGDRITGIQQPREATRFFLNGRAIGEIRDAEFTALFFGIWLSPKTSEPGLRKALISGSEGQS